MHTIRRSFGPALSLLALVLLVSCSKKEAAPPAKEGAVAPADQQQAANPTAPAAVASAPENPPPPSKSRPLPVGFKRRTGDLDEIVKGRNLRALVMISPVGFFYDKGLPEGVQYEALEELQRFANKKLKLGTLNLTVSFLPMAPSQLESALTEGLGDMIGYGIVVTPERETRGFLSPHSNRHHPNRRGGPSLGAVSSVQDLSGKQAYPDP